MYIRKYSCFVQDLAIGGWQLKHTAGDQEATYKFHRALHLKPDASVTVSKPLLLLYCLRPRLTTQTIYMREKGTIFRSYLGL